MEQLRFLADRGRHGLHRTLAHLGCHRPVPRWPAPGRGVVYFVLLLVTFGLGLVNAFVHARDAWGIMPEGLILSAAVAVTAALSTWFGFSSFRLGEMR